MLPLAYEITEEEQQQFIDRFHEYDKVDDKCLE